MDTTRLLCVAVVVILNVISSGAEAVDGGVGTWNTWSACSATCGGGSRIRTRDCDRPAPQDGGAECQETLQEADGCNTHPCPAGVGLACSRGAPVPCQDENSSCHYTDDLSGQTFCVCRPGYLSVRAAGATNTCQRLLSRQDDPACDTCITNDGQCYGDGDDVMAGCVCPPTTATVNSDCDTQLFDIACDASTIKVCYSHHNLPAHLDNFSRLNQSVALLYAVGFKWERDCHFMPGERAEEAPPDEYCLTVDFSASDNCGLVINNRSSVLTYSLEVNLQIDVSLACPRDIHVLAYCTYDKIRHLAAGLVDVIENKKLGIEGMSMRPSMQMQVFGEDDQDLQDTGVILGQMMKVELSVSHELDVYASLRAEVCLVSDMARLSHPDAGAVPFLLDSCPVGPLDPDSNFSPAEDPLVLTTGLFPAPSFPGRRYLFIHCAVKACILADDCQPHACTSRRKRRALPASLERKRRALPSSLEKFASPELEYEVVAVPIRDKPARAYAQGVEEEVPVPMWTVVGAVALALMLTASTLAALHCRRMTS